MAKLGSDNTWTELFMSYLLSVSVRSDSLYMDQPNESLSRRGSTCTYLTVLKCLQEGTKPTQKARALCRLKTLLAEDWTDIMIHSKHAVHLVAFQLLYFEQPMDKTPVLARHAKLHRRCILILILRLGVGVKLSWRRAEIAFAEQTQAAVKSLSMWISSCHASRRGTWCRRRSVLQKMEVSEQNSETEDRKTLFSWQ